MVEYLIAIAEDNILFSLQGPHVENDLVDGQLKTFFSVQFTYVQTNMETAKH